MKFSQFAGTAIVPTLSRVVLALAFVSVGYNKLFTEAEFSAADATVLRQLGVAVSGLPEAGGEVAVGAAVAEIVPASFTPQDEGSEKQEKGPASAPPPQGEDEPGDPDTETEAVTDEVVPGDVRVPAESLETAPDVPTGAGRTLPSEGVYSALGMHKITILCERHAWPYPKQMAILASLTEFVGGIMLLIGFLSRLWGLGLAATMGVAFYLVSMNILRVHEISPLAFATEIPRFNTLCSQLGLFVLGFGVFLTGPGPLSVDRLLFRRRGRGSSDSGEFVPDVDLGKAPSSRPL